MDMNDNLYTGQNQVSMDIDWTTLNLTAELSSLSSGEECKTLCRPSVVKIFSVN